MRRRHVYVLVVELSRCARLEISVSWSVEGLGVVHLSVTILYGLMGGLPCSSIPSSTASSSSESAGYWNVRRRRAVAIQITPLPMAGGRGILESDMVLLREDDAVAGIIGLNSAKEGL